MFGSLHGRLAVLLYICGEAKSGAYQRGEKTAVIFAGLALILTGAGVAEQADAPDLKSGGVKPRAGSSPAPGTKFHGRNANPVSRNSHRTNIPSRHF